MDNDNKVLTNCLITNDEDQILELLNSGLDPNYEGGWPIRLAARHGSLDVVRTLIQFGANPHILSKAGASTLQLAVYSDQHWERDDWNFLLSYCDSSQLADAAAVAIVFKNIDAFMKIMQTGRCNMHLPTTLTGKTVEQLVKGYKLQNLLSVPVSDTRHRGSITPRPSPRERQHRRETRTMTPQVQNFHRNLSPSVATFFHQTSSLSSPTLPRGEVSSPSNWAV